MADEHPSVELFPSDQRTITLLVTEMPQPDGGKTVFKRMVSFANGADKGNVSVSRPCNIVFEIGAERAELIEHLRFDVITGPDGKDHCGVFIDCAQGYATAFADGRKKAVVINDHTGPKIVLPYKIKLIDTKTGEAIWLDPGLGNDDSPTYP
jgi:hypothetical protein